MVDATDLKSVVLLGVRVRVPPSAPSFFLARGVRPPEISTRHSLNSIARRLPAVTQCLCDMDAANVVRPGKIGNRSGDPQDTRIAARG
ncbi:MAG: hypothetical protein RLZZ130_1118 [Pseudomonadota bacterium]